MARKPISGDDVGTGKKRGALPQTAKTEQIEKQKITTYLPTELMERLTLAQLELQREGFKRSEVHFSRIIEAALVLALDDDGRPARALLKKLQEVNAQY